MTFKSIWDVRLIHQEKWQKFRNTKIFISEDLSPDESEIFYKARQLKKAHKIQKAYTEEGKTMVQERRGQEPFELHEEHPLLKELDIVMTPNPKDNLTSVKKHDNKFPQTDKDTLSKMDKAKSKKENHTPMQPHTPTIQLDNIKLSNEDFKQCFNNAISKISIDLSDLYQQ